MNNKNEYYLRTKNKNIINKFSIPVELNNKDLKLYQAINIIEEYNNNHPHDIGIKTACTSPKIKNEQPKNEPPKNEQHASLVLERAVRVEQNKRGKILGKIGNENVFLNHSSFNNKYYLKTSKLKDNIPIPKDIDVNNLTFDKAKEIIDLHMIYNNKLIGVRDSSDVILKNG